MSRSVDISTVQVTFAQSAPSVSVWLKEDIKRRAKQTYGQDVKVLLFEDSRHGEEGAELSQVAFKLR